MVSIAGRIELASEPMLVLPHDVGPVLLDCMASFFARAAAHEESRKPVTERVQANLDQRQKPRTQIHRWRLADAMQPPLPARVGCRFITGRTPTRKITSKMNISQFSNQSMLPIGGVLPLYIEGLCYYRQK